MTHNYCTPLRSAILVLFTSQLAAQAPPSVTTLRSYAGAACQEALGLNCATDPNQSNLFYNIVSFLNAQPIASRTEATAVQRYLLPLMNANSSMKVDTVIRAFQAVGRSASYADQQQWVGNYNSWQTYQRLVQMVPRSATPATPPAPQPAPYTQAQQQQALQAAFVKVWARYPTSAEAARFSSTAPANMEGAVRSMLSGTPAEAARIADAVFGPTIGRQATAYERTGVISVFGRYWTGADDLATYLRGVSASYRTPNNGPQQAVGMTFTNGQVFLGFGNIPVKLPPVDSAGHLIAFDGSVIAAAGSGNHFDQNGVLCDAAGTPLPATKIVAQGAGNIILNAGGNIVAQGGGNIVAQGGGNIVAQGGGNIVAQGGGNIVSQGGGNIVSQGGGNIVAQGGGNYKLFSLQALVSMGAYALYDVNTVARMRASGGK